MFIPFFLQDPPLPPNQPNFMFSFSLFLPPSTSPSSQHGIWFVFAHHSWCLSWIVVNIYQVIPLKKQSNANSSTDEGGGGTSYLLLLLHAEILSDLNLCRSSVCCHRPCTFILPCFVWKPLSPWSHLSPLALKIILPTLRHKFLSLKEKGVI